MNRFDFPQELCIDKCVASKTEIAEPPANEENYLESHS